MSQRYPNASSTINEYRDEPPNCDTHVRIHPQPPTGGLKNHIQRSCAFGIITGLELVIWAHKAHFPLTRIIRSTATSAIKGMSGWPLHLQVHMKDQVRHPSWYPASSDRVGTKKPCPLPFQHRQPRQNRILRCAATPLAPCNLTTTQKTTSPRASPHHAIQTMSSHCSIKTTCPPSPKPSVKSSTSRICD